MYITKEYLEKLIEAQKHGEEVQAALDKSLRDFKVKNPKATNVRLAGWRVDGLLVYVTILYDVPASKWLVMYRRLCNLY